jgi:flagellar protein FlaG
MSITPLNISATGDSGATYALPKSAAQPDPVVSTVAASATPEQQQQKSYTQSDADEAVSKLNDFAAANAPALNFSQDKETGETVIKVVDTDTDKVIRQIPTVEAIAVSKSIEKMRGLLVHEKA